MAHGIGEMLSPVASPATGGAKQQPTHPSSGSIRKSVGVMGSRRIFAPTFKLKVLNSYRNDLDCRGNQRATARKYNIHRRQIQKWLQCEASLRNCAASSVNGNSGVVDSPSSPDSTLHPLQHQQQQSAPTLNPVGRARLHGDEQQQQQPPPPPPPPPTLPLAAAAQPSAITAAAAAASTYRFLSQHYDYPQQLVYPTPATAMPYQFAAAFQPPALHYATTPEEQHPQQQHPVVVDIKRERASPDSSPLYHHHHHHHHHQQQLKKERTDTYEEVCNASFSSGISDQASSSCSPVPSHLESLPPSPRESTGSSGSDSDADSSSGALPHHHHQQHLVTGSNADLARRRSFSLRFKLRVLDAFHADKHCRKNQRATARKFNINRRQVQKWLSQEHDLRDPTQHRGANRQRLGSHSPATEDKWQQQQASIKRERLASPHEETAVDLRTAGPEFNYRALSPNSYVDTALTPPYSQSGCTLSCCSQEQPTYHCYSPSQTAAQQQEQPLCLVKPKSEPVSSTVPSPPAVTPPKKDAILFKPYLDNPVSKPAPASPTTNNNNSQETCNLNDIALDVSFRPAQHHYVQPQQQQSYPHLEIPQARSAFVRYPAYLQ